MQSSHTQDTAITLKAPLHSSVVSSLPLVSQATTVSPLTKHHVKWHHLECAALNQALLLNVRFRDLPALLLIPCHPAAPPAACPPTRVSTRLLVDMWAAPVFCHCR